jgi:hypothetical protein
VTLPAVRDAALETLQLLEQSGSLHATGLVLTTEIPYDQYESLLAYIASVHRRSAWALGDALIYGEAAYGERYAQAAVVTGFTEQYLQNLASICRRVPRPRRRPELSMGHHDVVAKMEPAEQEEWLERASRERWTRADLRAKVDEVEGKPLPPAVCSCCGRPRD